MNTSSRAVWHLDSFVPAENSLALHNTGSGNFRVLSPDLGQTLCARGQELAIYHIGKRRRSRPRLQALGTDCLLYILTRDCGQAFLNPVFLSVKRELGFGCEILTAKWLLPSPGVTGL